MTDLDSLLPDRLRHLADEQAPARDPLAQAAAARTRYRLQRRARVAAAGIVTAVAAIAIGVPLTFSALAAPDGGRVAGPGTATPGAATAASDTSGAAPASETAAAARERAAALAQEAAASAAAQAASAAASPGPAQPEIAPAARAVLAAEEARGAAEVADALVVLDSPVRLGTLPAGASCPDAAAVLGRGLGAHVAYEQGSLRDGRGGCQWSTDGDAPMASQPQVRLTVGVAYEPLPVARVVDSVSRVNGLVTPGRCLTVPATAVDPGAVLHRCANAGEIDWDLDVPSADGTGTWVLGTWVGDDVSSPGAGAALREVAALATATWGD